MLPKEEAKTEVRGPIPFLGFDPEIRTINLPDGRVAAYMTHSAFEVDPTLVHKMAAAPALVEALQAVMDGCHYGSITMEGQSLPPTWHSIRMPTPEVMDKVRAALALATAP